MPPIINGDHSKITLNTKNIFIDVTAVDLHKAEVVLDTLVTMFSEYCSPKFEIEAVEVTFLDGSKSLYPKLMQRDEIIDVDFMNRRVGINIDAARVAALLGKMCLDSQVVNDKQVKVRIPPTRSDILHACDIIEDLGISYGYNNIETKFPNTNCFSEEVNSYFQLTKMDSLLIIESI